MDPITIAGLGTSVVGNVVGGIQTAKINNQRQNNLNNEKAYSENLFNKQYYEDVMKRSENQSFLRQLQRNQDENQKKSARTAAITGATPEATAAQAKNDSQIYADAVNKLVSVASQRKDQALADYNRRRGQLFGMQDNIGQERAAAWGNFMQNASTLGNAALSATASPVKGNTANVDVVGAMHKNAKNAGLDALNKLQNGK